MRYAYISDPQDPKYLQIPTKVMISVEGDQATVHLATRPDYKDTFVVLYQDKDGVCITSRDAINTVNSKALNLYNMLLPETHPLFNYGIITDTYFDSEVARYLVRDIKSTFNKQLVKLFKKLEQHIKNS